MKITVFYVGSSLLAPLRNAERDINREHGVDLQISAYNFGAPLNEDEWRNIENDLNEAEVVFVIHVMDGENAARLLPALERHRASHRAVIVINCMPELMRRTRMGRLDFQSLLGMRSRQGEEAQKSSHKSGSALKGNNKSAVTLLRSISSWIAKQARGSGAKNGHGRTHYLKFADRLPSLLRFIPGTGPLRDMKNYLTLFCYFLQPTPANIRSMILYALQEYGSDARLEKAGVPPPESMPSVAIYHPDAPSLFESFDDYEIWYGKQNSKSKDQSSKINRSSLAPESTVGLLLMRPQIVSNTRKHYDALIRAIEVQRLSVIPAISTLMDNREACEKFFLEPGTAREVGGERSEVRNKKTEASDNGKRTTGRNWRSRVSQIVSLTGFSFVGGPAMNDSEAAARFLGELNIPFRSLVSLDTQTIDSWRASFTGLNPVQTGMQVAIPEIDGATEPFVFGGIPERGVEPAPLADRCQRIARRLARWNRLQTSVRDELKLALVLYCFPPNKGNIGTAADLDVFASLFEVLTRLKQEGYRVSLPDDVDALREIVIGDSERFSAPANVAYRMTTEEYLRLCPFVAEIESEWGSAPGAINSHGDDLLIQGIQLDGVFIGVQPTFGYEGDPMRLLMAKGGTPHHGFAAFYTYLEKVFQADAVIHVGTHGAMEFMPGKQVGLSSECWPDRLIGELPNIYIYSVNNPSEGTIAKRRSYAELISYLTPPIENAGLYKGLASLKDAILAYRQTTDEQERERLFNSIEELGRQANFNNQMIDPAAQVLSP